MNDDIVFQKTEIKKTKYVIKQARFPMLKVSSVLKTRKERICFVCDENFSKQEDLGLMITDKGNKLCCEKCGPVIVKMLEKETIENINL